MGGQDASVNEYPWMIFLFMSRGELHNINITDDIESYCRQSVRNVWWLNPQLQVGGDRSPLRGGGRGDRAGTSASREYHHLSGGP